MPWHVDPKLKGCIEWVEPVVLLNLKQVACTFQSTLVQWATGINRAWLSTTWCGRIVSRCNAELGDGIKFLVSGACTRQPFFIHNNPTQRHSCLYLTPLLLSTLLVHCLQQWSHDWFLYDASFLLVQLLLLLVSASFLLQDQLQLVRLTMLSLLNNDCQPTSRDSLIRISVTVLVTLN